MSIKLTAFMRLDLDSGQEQACQYEDHCANPEGCNRSHAVVRCPGPEWTEHAHQAAKCRADPTDFALLVIGDTVRQERAQGRPDQSCAEAVDHTNGIQHPKRRDTDHSDRRHGPEAGDC